MKGWLVLYWDRGFGAQEWEFYYNEKKMIEFLMSDGYSTIRDILEAENLKSVKAKYAELLNKKPKFPGVMF